MHGYEGVMLVLCIPLQVKGCQRGIYCSVLLRARVSSPQKVQDLK